MKQDLYCDFDSDSKSIWRFRSVDIVELYAYLYNFNLLCRLQYIIMSHWHFAALRNAVVNSEVLMGYWLKSNESSYFFAVMCHFPQW